MSENNGTPNPAELMLNDEAYNQLLKDAEKDNRVGDHDAIIAKVTNDNWPSGDPRQKVDFVLVTANNAKADLTLSPPPSPAVVAAESANWEPGKKRGVAASINIYRQAIQHYGVAITSEGRLDLKEGQRFKVKTAKTRRDEDGKGGFIRVIALLPKDHAVGSQVAASGAATAPSF